MGLRTFTFTTGNSIENADSECDGSTRRWELGEAAIAQRMIINTIATGKLGGLANPMFFDQKVQYKAAAHL